MNNYEYIIADFPVLAREAAGSDRVNADALIQDLRAQLDEKDVKVLDFLLEGFDSDKLCKEFYEKALSHRSRFIREYFKFDLNLRNVKVDFLNRELGRAEGTDKVLPDALENESFDREAEVKAALDTDDILGRERNLDDLVWNAVDEINALEIFNLDIILGFVAKLKVIDRWLKLDDRTGRELFRKLIEQVRSTYDNKKQNLI